MAIKIEGFDTASGSPISGGLVYKGSYDAATNTPILTSSSKGDFYIVSVAGTLAGVTLNVGDHIVFNQNASSPITASMFDVIDNTDSVTSVNTQVGAVVLDTDDISETATNQYFTAARFDTQLATKDTDDLTEGVSNLYFTSPRFTSELATKTTDNLTEGVSNLYYTNTRFDTQLATKDTDDLTEGVSNLYYTNTRFDTQLATKDTDDLTEGATNQYFTNTRADARIAAADLTDLNDVDYTAGAGIDGRVLTYVNANSRWEAVAPSGGSVGTLQQVTDQGSTTTTNISTAQITLGGDLLADAVLTRTIGDETNRFITSYSDLNGAVRFKAKASVALSKGDIVYIDGVSGGVPTVSKAQSNSASTMPAFGLCYAAASLNADVEIVTLGNLDGINTGSFSVGDTLYVSSTTAGALTNSAPTSESNLIQNIAKVVKVDAVGNSGIYKVGGAGRTAATPNLNQDKIFLGNASNQAVSTALSSVNLSSFNNNLDTDDISEGVTNLYYTNTRFDTQLATKDTDDVSEGVTNQYFTNTRADARIAAADLTDLNDVDYTAGAGIDGRVLTYVNANSRWEAVVSPSAPVTSVNTQTGAVILDTDDISEGVTNLYYTNTRFDNQLSTKTTDNLTEGVSNLYYTNTRFDNQLSTKTTDNLTEGVTNLYYTNTRFDTQLATKDTDDVSEGVTNQYFTNTRADARIAAANLTDLNDVDYTAGAGIDGRVLTYVNANSRWEAVAPSGGGGGFTYSAITSASSPVTGVIEYHYSADTSGGAITIDLPAIAAGNSGKEIRVKLKTAGNNLVLSPNGTDQVEAGGAGVDYTLTVQNTAITLVSDGSSNWEII